MKWVYVSHTYTLFKNVVASVCIYLKRDFYNHTVEIT